MDTYSSQLAVLHDFIINGTGADANNWVVDRQNFTPAEQIMAYVMGYRYRLYDITAQDYPALQKHLGDNEFDKLLKQFVNKAVSNHNDIANYQTQLPQYLKGFTYELATLESQIALLSNAHNNTALTTADIQNLAPSDLLATKFKPRAALKLLPLNYNVNEYYSAFINNQELPTIQQQQNHLAIYQHNHKVWRLSISHNEHFILSGFAKGQSFGEVLEDMLNKNLATEQELMQKISAWIGKFIQNHLLAK